MQPIAVLLFSVLTAQAQVLIPSGSFSMGRTKATADDKTTMRPQVLLDDRPVHTVRLNAYYIDAKEVTQAEYAAFVAASKRPAAYNWTGGKMPPSLAKVAVYNVSWDDASAYCAYYGKRLPTEAEWERAARGGLEGQDFPWGDKFDPKAARLNTSSGAVAPGEFPPNAFGLYDMAGNVSEWTADFFARDYYAHSPASDPRGPETGQYRVIRGGAWSDSARRATVYFRNWVRPSQKQPNIGFRCAKDGPDAITQLREKIAKFPAKVTLFARNLDSGKEFGIEADQRVRTASTIKLPILIALYTAVAEGNARWDELLTLHQEDKVSGSGVIFEFPAESKLPLLALANLMIVVSDNTATNLILDRIGADAVNDVMEKLGIHDTRANRKILGDGNHLKPVASGWSRFGLGDDNKKYGIGMSSPKDMVGLLTRLEKGELVSATASKEILDTLKRQQYKDGIGRHMKFPVASKSGALDALRSDVGIVYTPQGRIAMAITVDGMAKPDYSPDNAGLLLISDLAQLLIESLTR